MQQCLLSTFYFLGTVLMREGKHHTSLAAGIHVVRQTFPQQMTKAVTIHEVNEGTGRGAVDP